MKLTGIPVLCDMNPKTENTTNPAIILVALLQRGTTIESLKKKRASYNNKLCTFVQLRLLTYSLLLLLKLL